MSTQTTKNEQTTSWKLLDCSRIDPFVSSLSHQQRKKLYTKMTKDFTITITKSTNSVSDEKWLIKGLESQQFPSQICSLPFYKKLIVLPFLTILITLYGFPVFYTLYGMYLIYHTEMTKFIIWLIIYIFLLFYPHKKWKGYTNNALFMLVLQYFSWRFAWHPSVAEYIEKQQQPNSECNTPIIFISLPHGVVPMASVLSQTVHSDLFTDNVRGVSAGLCIINNSECIENILTD